MNQKQPFHPTSYHTPHLTLLHLHLESLALDTGPTTRNVAMGNYRTNRQKAKLFEDLIFEVYKMPKGGHSLTLKERDVVIQQIHLAIPEVDLLTPDVCQKMVTGIKDCLKKACQGQWNGRFDWIKMVTTNILREAMNTIRQKHSEDQEVSTLWDRCGVG